MAAPVFTRKIYRRKLIRSGCPFKQDTSYFDPSQQPFMFNLVVDDLHGALNQVAQAGAVLIGEPEDLEYGLFGWFMDPEGNKVELWEPK